MLTVSNTSPLLNLAIIDHLSLLEKQFQTVYVPESVLAELRVNENLNGSNHLKVALEKGWLKVQPVQNKAFVQLLRRELDQGESEAIALAIEKQADLILLDEKEGRRIARTLNLKITGILGIAIKASQNGDLESISEFIQTLRTQAHFHISPSLEREILAKSK
jgi:predicted nucleic acid-binding protein